MSLTISVNGEAQIKTGTGSAGALEQLGVSVDGVGIRLNLYNEPVYTDTFGPKVPFDAQYFLEDAIVTCQLVFFDETVVEKLLARKTGGTAGVLASAGRLMGQSGDFYRLLILSPVAALPWNFLKAYLDDAQPTKVGVRRTIWDLTWRCIPYTGVAGDTSGTIIYNRVTA